MTQIIYIFYFAFALGVSICIQTDQYLEQCVYAVGAFTTIDLVFIMKKYRTKPDMIFHHIFSLFIVAFFHNHAYIETCNLHEKDLLIKGVLSTEISSIFLAIYKILKTNKYVVLRYSNNTAYLATFVYYRIYSYYVNIISRDETNRFIIGISKNDYHLATIYMGLYGLFALNLYWVPLSVYTLCKSPPRGGDQAYSDPIKQNT